ncbi:hypothetical protein G9F71_008440 [Clostridium sp. FP2]|uniref:hypothetical protein n=1 Tax=Clostridium sp. FP2 TaxID=2724481 RepID=UPI0013E92AFC|nr:hypothetical protein [Clostridium sp. FP2]MBZ9622880.1 hypothetical protein [Clostridium sp. FP2]
MTNIEKKKCENLCIEAIKNIEESNSLYEEAEKIDREFHQATTQLRRADNKRGYAEGINQALAVIGYTSENMKKLSKLI